MDNGSTIDTEAKRYPSNLDEILKERMPDYHGHGGVDDLFRMESYMEDRTLYADEFRKVKLNDLMQMIDDLKFELYTDAMNNRV